MPKYYDTFDHFARDLFLHVTPFKMASSDKDKLDPILLMDDASYVLKLFADGHCELFRRIFVMTEDEVLQTDKQFFMLALPRCLNLIDTDRYFFSIMLVAGFLQELVTYLGETRVCYRFHFTAYKCLVAVFKRAFINSFESNGGWNGLEKYLIRVIEVLHSTKENLIMSALNDGDNLLTKRVVNLIRNCDDVSDDFSLNEYENSLLMDADIKDLEESLNYDKVDYDHVLTWPLKEEEIHRKLNYMKEMTLTNSQTSNDSNEVRDMDDYSPPDDFNAEKDMGGSSHHPSYPNTGKDVGGSAPPLSDHNAGKDMEGSEKTEKFLKKMEKRTCPCCRLKCYQFSYKLFTKQIDSALNNKNGILRTP